MEINAKEREMHTDCFIIPARKTTDDEGNVVSRKPAILHRNDGIEESWHFDTTADAKWQAELMFNVTEWERDDLGRYFSK